MKRFERNQKKLLNYLKANPSWVSLTFLAYKVNLKSGSVHQYLKPLVHKGIIEKKTDHSKKIHVVSKYRYVGEDETC